MRFKNFTLLFLMGIFGLFTTNLFAQEDATIDPADIRYWIGEGENEVVFIVNWAEPDTALAWGYRFNDESVTIKDVMDGIAEVDYRFTYEASGSWLMDLHFNDGYLDLSLTEQMWTTYLVNGESSWDTFDEKTLVDGDYIKWGDTYCGTLVDPENYIYVFEEDVVPVYPLADEATIDPSEILYWVGQGENEIVFAVNWNEPNRCLAWGYRFDGESKILKEVMDDIAAADSRFAYVVGSWGIDDITFDEGDLHYGLSGMWWLYNVNGVMGYLGFDGEVLVDGDFVKWGDESCATEIAEWTYVWEQEVEPVWVPTGVNENVMSLSVYPNPAVSETFVTISDAGMNEISVYDMQGRMVSTVTVAAMEGEQVRVSTEMLNSGVYFISVNSESTVRTAKLVVK